MTFLLESNNGCDLAFLGELDVVRYLDIYFLCHPLVRDPDLLGFRRRLKTNARLLEISFVQVNLALEKDSLRKLEMSQVLIGAHLKLKL